MTDTLQRKISDAFTRLADLLETQPGRAWDSPSLCAAWRVREVVAHMTTAARYRADEFLAEVQADSGDFSRTIERIAARDGRLDPATLLANLRDERLHQWTPPGGGEHGALIHVVIHGLDTTVPLDADYGLPDDTMRTVLDTLAGGGVHAHFGTTVEGVELRATDLDWTWGRGRPVTATATELALALCARLEIEHLGRDLGERGGAGDGAAGA